MVSMGGFPQVIPARRATGSLMWVSQEIMIPSIACAVLVYLAVFPLYFLIVGSFYKEVAPNVHVIGIDGYSRLFGTPANYKMLLNTLAFATGSTLVALIGGTGSAWLVTRTNTPLAAVFSGIAIVPLVIPGVIEVVAWIFLLSPRIGWVNQLLHAIGIESPPLNIYSMGGMIWVQGLAQTPLAFVLMSAAFRSIDANIEEAAETCGAGPLQTLRDVTLPVMLPALGAVALLMFVRGLEAFETPAIIGIPARTYVLTGQIFLALRRYPPDFGFAGAMGISLILITAVGVRLYQPVLSHSERFQIVTGKGFRPCRWNLGRWRWAAAGALSMYFMITVGLPLSVLVWTSFSTAFSVPNLAMVSLLSLDNYAKLFQMQKFATAVRNSLFLALLSATVVMILTSILAWIVLRTRLRMRQSVDYLAFLPISIPGIVLGVSLIWMYITLPVPIYGTIWILLIAYVTKFLPIGMRASCASLAQIHKELEEASAVSGGDWLVCFRKIVLPLMAPGLLAGWVYVFVLSFKELSASILLGSSGNTVLAVLLFDLIESAESPQVAALSVVMIAIIIPIALLSRWMATTLSAGG